MNCTFIVARYKPKGNIDSEAAFKENVDRGTFDPMAYNCSAVNCSSVAEEENQVQDSTGKKLQENRMPDESRNVKFQNGILDSKEPQRYSSFNYKTSQSNVLGYQGSHDYVQIQEYDTKHLGTPGNKGYGDNQYNSEERRQRYILNRTGRPRSTIYRAKIPHSKHIKVL